MVTPMKTIGQIIGKDLGRWASLLNGAQSSDGSPIDLSQETIELKKNGDLFLELKFLDRACLLAPERKPNCKGSEAGWRSTKVLLSQNVKSVGSLLCTPKKKDKAFIEHSTINFILEDGTRRSIKIDRNFAIEAVEKSGFIWNDKNHLW